MDPAILERIGLTRNESIVYLTLLQLGTSKTGPLLSQAKLNSGKIYEILDSLKDKGLVSESIINSIKHFTAAPPKQILEFLQEKKATIEKEESSIKTELATLEQLRSMNIAPVRAVTYTGFKGIQAAANEALASVQKGEDIVAMGVTNRKEDKYNAFWKRWSIRRLERKIVAKHIFSEESDYYRLFGKMKYTEARVLTGITPVTVDIFGSHTTLILNYNEPVSCILIHDKNTATSFRQFFEQLWKQAIK